MKDKSPESLKVRALACCLKRASLAAGGDESPASDVYWHTREAIGEICRRERLFFPNVLRMERDSSFAEYSPGPMGWRFVLSENFRYFSEMYWDEVAHPSLLVEDVMSS